MVEKMWIARIFNKFGQIKYEAKYYHLDGAVIAVWQNINEKEGDKFEIIPWIGEI